MHSDRSFDVHQAPVWKNGRNIVNRVNKKVATLGRLERVFRCCSVCETMEDYKGYLMVWTNYVSSCNSIAGLYFEGTCDVISYQSNAQGAQKRPINFTFCKLPERLIRWPTIFISLLESSQNSLTFQTVWTKFYLVELKYIYFKEKEIYGLQIILLDSFHRNFYIWSAVVNGACVQKIKIGRWAKFRARNKIIFSADFISGSRDFTQDLTSGVLILIHAADASVCARACS